MSPLHAAALKYASQGIPVFPIFPARKEPATPHSFKDATTDPAIVNAWWTDNPNYNIGTEPAASGRLVVDIDTKEGRPGARTWSDLCAEHGDPPETMMVRTPSGGWHIYFTGTLRPSVGKDGIDIRSEGSYVLLPPSMVDGMPYIYLAPGPCAVAPAWIGARWGKQEHAPASAPAGIEVDPPGIEEWVAKVVEAEIDANGIAEIGNGVNDRRFRLACTLRDGPAAGITISEELAVELINELWLDAPRTGETVRNAYRSGENAPGCGPVGDPVRTYGAAEGWDAHRGEQAPTAPPAGQKSRFLGRKPSEAATRAPLTYFDSHRRQCALPRIPDDGAALIVTGPRSSHKTGVVIKECMDAGVRVLYLAYEGGHGMDTQRLPAVARQRGIAIEELDERWTTLSTGPNLTARSELDELIHVYREWKPEIVVLDTLTRAAVGVDINAPAAGTGIIDGMEYLARGFGGALVIGVHHPGKDATRGGLGSSLIESLAYAIWRVSVDRNVVFVKVDKMKDGPADFTIPLKVVPIGGVPVIAEIPAEERAQAVRQTTAPTALTTFRLQVIAAIGRVKATGDLTIPIVAEEMAREAEVKDRVAAYESIRRRIYRHAEGRNGEPGALTDLFVLDPTGHVLVPHRFKS